MEPNTYKRIAIIAAWLFIPISIAAVFIFLLQGNIYAAAWAGLSLMWAGNFLQVI